jgi:amino acid permease
MTRGQKRLRATLALIGTIIGAGVFGVPAMIGAWGVALGTVGFIVITLLVLGVHVLLAEAVSVYKSPARLAGLAHYWLGPAGGIATGMAQTLQTMGSNLAYLILGGEFLSAIAWMCGVHVSTLAWQTFFWAMGVVVVVTGLGWMARIEAHLTWALVGVMLLMIFVLTGRMELSLIAQLPTQWTIEPYGIFLFALLGTTVIPELEELTSGNAADFRTSVVRGTLVAAMLTYAFGVSAWLASSGMLGRQIADVIALLPPALAFIVPVFGFLAVATSYFTTSYDLDAMFRVDFQFAPWLARIVTLGVPFALLFLTTRDFLSVIGLVGSVFSAAVAVVCVLVGRAALHQSRRAAMGTPAWVHQEVVPWTIIVLLSVGAVMWLFTSV